MNKINQILLTLVLVFALQSTAAQKLSPSSLKQLELSTHKQIVSQALSYNDLQTAINSMHHIIALEGESSTYKDSLAITYFNAQNYVSSHLLAKELLASKPTDVQLLAINARSLQGLNASKEAITAYEPLFSQTNNMEVGYQLASLQFGLKRFSEAQTTIVKTLQCKDMENAYLPFPVDETQNQNVLLKSAAYNLQGLIAYELKDTATASAAFKAALELAPDFVLASQNAKAVGGVLAEETELEKTENSTK